MQVDMLQADNHATPCTQPLQSPPLQQRAYATAAA